MLHEIRRAVLFFSALLCVTNSTVHADLRPYTGDSVAGVDRETLAGKIMCGYQGWFTTPTDGSNKGWSHYQYFGKFEPGSCRIDLWPDVSELGADEKFPTPFRFSDGTVASVFSSANRKTVLRHFEWMRQYGIDGVFVQRFVNETQHPPGLAHCNVVLDNCRAAANQTGRVYALMYDLSGMQGAAGVDQVIEDYKTLVDQMRLGHDEHDKAYLRHRGRPVVAVWGIGFGDRRSYTLADSRRFIDFLKDDPDYGNNTVMLGVPTGWRSKTGDAAADFRLMDAVEKADVISPWTVGRYSSPEGAQRHAAQHWKPDIEWCQAHGKDYLPVVFSGFSWHNMHRDPTTGPAPRRSASGLVFVTPLDQIPRLKGRFQWAQYAAAKSAGATMIYQAMFDEIYEGTAIFKITNNPPAGPSPFVTLEGLPSDHYLWLAGMAGKLLRGEIPLSDDLPNRK